MVFALATAREEIKDMACDVDRINIICKHLLAVSVALGVSNAQFRSMVAEHGVSLKDGHMYGRKELRRMLRKKENRVPLEKIKSTFFGKQCLVERYHW